MASIISGTGSYIPTNEVDNSNFINNTFYTEKGELMTEPGDVITGKFKDITGIAQRRYVTNDLNTSDIGAIAAQKAIEDAGIDPETIDHIIATHNFGDVRFNTIQADVMPSLASRIKQKLKINNPYAVAYDVLFGCPGWIQCLIQADSFIKSGLATNCLVIGCETLSRVLDDHDRDSMIFSDGAGACILQKDTSGKDRGIISSASVTHALEEADYLFMGKSNKPGSDPKVRYIKMQGRKIYEYALTKVPQAMKEALDKSGYGIHDLKKVFIHQANEKMDEAIIHRFYRLYKEKNIPEHIMPMSIHRLGNSSVATVPTLLDLVRKGELEEHNLQDGDVILLASVGAGMSINAIVYKV